MTAEPPNEPAELPPLPEPEIYINALGEIGTYNPSDYGYGMQATGYFIAEQMQAYARSALKAALPQEPAVRIYWHAHQGWQVEWQGQTPNGGQSNFYYAAPPAAQVNVAAQEPASASAAVAVRGSSANDAALKAARP